MMDSFSESFLVIRSQEYATMIPCVWVLESYQQLPAVELMEQIVQMHTEIRSPKQICNVNGKMNLNKFRVELMQN